MWMSNSISALWLIVVITGPSSVPGAAGPPGPGAGAGPALRRWAGRAAFPILPRTEEVVGHDHVEPLGVGDQEHRRRVHVAVVDGDLAGLLGRLGHGSLPQVARILQHVGLVYQREVLPRPPRGQPERVPDHAAHPE